MDIYRTKHRNGICRITLFSNVSLNDPQENVDDDELAMKHALLQLLVFGESLSLMHTNLYQHRLLLSCTWTPTKFGGKNGKYQNIMLGQ